LTKAKKNSTIHTTGMFFFAENQLYCEILEFQFISAKIESDNSIVVPWKSKTNLHTERSSKSAIEQRIALVQQNLATQPPSSTKPLTSAKNKRKTNMTKIADISRSLLLQNQQGDEIHDSEISITNEENGERIDENTDEDEERFENIEEKNNAKISDSTRSKKKQKTK
jgi:hypothetical protein